MSFNFYEKMNQEELLNTFIDHNIYITGANGFIGTSLCNELIKKNIKIHAISRSNINKKNYPTIVANITDTSFWINILREKSIIYHLACNTSLNWCEQNPLGSIRDNVLPMAAICEAAKITGTKPKVIFAGSATQAGFNTNLNINESQPDDPISIYDLHKCYAEQQMILSSKQKIIDGISLRLSNVYGPGVDSKNSDRNIVAKIINKAITSKEINIYGDGTAVRDYVYIEDVVQAFLSATMICDTHPGSYYLIGTGIGMSIYDAFSLIANKITTITKNKIKVTLTPWPSDIHPINKRSAIIDSFGFKQRTHWQPLVDFNTGINNLITSICS